MADGGWQMFALKGRQDNPPGLRRWSLDLAMGRALKLSRMPANDAAVDKDSKTLIQDIIDITTLDEQVSSAHSPVLAMVEVRTARLDLLVGGRLSAGLLVPLCLFRPILYQSGWLLFLT
jgi:hypothetical protein